MAKKKLQTAAIGDPFASDGEVSTRSGVAPLNRFKRYPGNARLHPPAEIAMLAAIFKSPYRRRDQPIVVDEDWLILKGHGRLDAAYAAKIDDFPYVQYHGLPEAEKIAMRIEDNQVALLAGWSQELIRGEISQLRGFGYQVSMLGFGDTQLVQFETLPGPPAEFQKVDDDIHVDRECPKCGYTASGDWKPKPKPAKGKTKSRRK